jgi:hypothetical protein
VLQKPNVEGCRDVTKQEADRLATTKQEAEPRPRRLDSAQRGAAAKLRGRSFTVDGKTAVCVGRTGWGPRCTGATLLELDGSITDGCRPTSARSVSPV